MKLRKLLLRYLGLAGVLAVAAWIPAASHALLITFDPPDASNSIDGVNLIDANTIELFETIDSPFASYWMDDIDPFAGSADDTGLRDISFNYSITCGVDFPDCLDPADPISAVYFDYSFAENSGDVLIEDFDSGVGGTVTVEFFDVAVDDQFGFMFDFLVDAGFEIFDGVVTIWDLDVSLAGVVEPPEPNPIPLPGALILMLTGLGALGVSSRFKRAV